MESESLIEWGLEIPKDYKLGMEDSVKNNADAIIFRTAKCVAGATFSIYRRAKSDI